MSETRRTVTPEEQKQIMLEMLVDFDRFCKAHNLRYYLTGGTLLGAIRHKGYIPWDDDIDVGLPRYDYEQFVDLYNKEKTNENYEFVSFHQNPDLYVSSGKLFDKRTVFEEAIESTVQIGIYIDVFPLDNLGNTEEEARAFTEQALKIRKQLDVQNWKVIKERAWYKNLVIRMIKLFSPKGKRRELIEKQDRFCKSNMSKDLSAYVGYPCAAMKQELLKGGWYKETIEVPFENHEVSVPKEYDKVLSVFYGSDYMTPPPLDKQKTHHAYNAWWVE